MGRHIILAVFTMLVCFSPAVGAQESDDITGYREWLFGKPVTILTDDDYMYFKFDEEKSVGSYNGFSDLMLPNCNIDTMQIIQSLGKNEGEGTIEAIAISFGKSDITRTGSTPLPTIDEVVSDLRDIILDKYAEELIEVNEYAPGAVYLFLRDEDNDTLWLEMKDGRVSLGYKSAVMRKHTDSLRNPEL